MSTDGVTLRITNSGGLRTIAFDNARKKNAISRATYIGLADAINSAATDDSVNVLALTGIGEYFSSGNDIGSFAEVTDLDAYADESVIYVRNLTHAFIRFPKLFVAVVNGPSIGIAATLIALCDVIYAVDKAFFYTPFTAMGLSAEGCSTYTFPKILGPSKAAEVLLYNHRLSAAEALQFGFVSELFTLDELDTKLWPRLRELANLAHGSVRATKQLVNRQREQELLGACEQELYVLRQRMTCEESFNAMIKFMGRKSKL